jgi:hypothetical protein
MCRRIAPETADLSVRFSRLYQTSISPDNVRTSMIVCPRKSSDSRVNFCMSLARMSSSSSLRTDRLVVARRRATPAGVRDSPDANFDSVARVVTFARHTREEESTVERRPHTHARVTCRCFTRRTSRSTTDSIPSRPSSCASSPCQLERSRTDRTCPTCPWLSDLEHLSLQTEERVHGEHAGRTH